MSESKSKDAEPRARKKPPAEAVSDLNFDTSSMIRRLSASSTSQQPPILNDEYVDDTTYQKGSSERSRGALLDEDSSVERSFKTTGLAEYDSVGTSSPAKKPVARVDRRVLLEYEKSANGDEIDSSGLLQKNVMDSESDDEEEESLGYGQRGHHPTRLQLLRSRLPQGIRLAWIVVGASLFVLAGSVYFLNNVRGRSHPIPPASASGTERAAENPNTYFWGVPWYDATASTRKHDPFHLLLTDGHDSDGDDRHASGKATSSASPPSWYGSVFSPPPPYPGISSDARSDTHDNLGYFQSPNIHDGVLVFRSEGDLYLSYLPQSIASAPPSDWKEVMVSMKLTTTVGNVLTPHINPKFPFLLAFTATYTGTREAYIMDLRPNHRSRPSLRVTYFDAHYGCQRVVGWADDGTTLLVAAQSMDYRSPPDVRVYKIGILQSGDDDVHARRLNEHKGMWKYFYVEADDDDDEVVGESERESSLKVTAEDLLNSSSPPATVALVTPLPLAQAINGVFHDSCFFFTRTTQSSSTARYVGGTAENLWAYCDNRDAAVALTWDYKGASKNPIILDVASLPDIGNESDGKFLLFLSDRISDDEKWVPSTMNIWAAPLPSETDMYESSEFVLKPFRLTSVACESGGIPAREYSVDSVRGDIIVRVGADLQVIPARDVVRSLREGRERGLRRNLFAPKRRANENESGGAGIPDGRDVEASDTNDDESIDAAVSNRLPIVVYSDFHEMHERHISFDFDKVGAVDAFATAHSETSTLLTVRGQVYVAPILPNTDAKTYAGDGMNIPRRRYRVSPGSSTGGMLRILTSRYVSYPPGANQTAFERALVLATDPLSATGEHALYILRVDSGLVSAFSDSRYIPKPILGGALNGGSVVDGGLGSVNAESLTVSPCGRRAGWTDTDGRIVVITVPSGDAEAGDVTTTVLPAENEQSQPIPGAEAGISWSPLGRYLAIQHGAKNQFSVITLVDCGPPEDGVIDIKRVVQVTPDRFNSFSPYWGRSSKDFAEDERDITTLYFLSDRDILSVGAKSPWGTRAPSPTFADLSDVYALPLFVTEDGSKNTCKMPSVGSGAAELMEARKAACGDDSENSTSLNGSDETSSHVATDPDISFGPIGDRTYSFARRAYRLSAIPSASFVEIVSQLQDDPSLVFVENSGIGKVITLYKSMGFPSDDGKKVSIEFVAKKFKESGTSTTRKHLYFVYDGDIKVIPNTIEGVSAYLLGDDKFSTAIVDTKNFGLSVWPALEYQQMYSDAWRMLRDYYYDPGMTGIDWLEVHHRYQPLVSRCSKREELDDVLAQMASELSALHVFVYGGEYNTPKGGTGSYSASLGAVLERSVEMGGYIVKSIPERDPDFSSVNGDAIYSPLSDRVLRMSGQRGLQEGDVIVGVNGETVLNIPSIYMLLRGTAGRSVRLEVLRLKSGKSSDDDEKSVEPVLVVPIRSDQAAELRYSAWEWKTRQLAKSLAEKEGFSVGYAHLRMMDVEGEQAFARGFFPDYDKDAFIVDVRHNRGGNIDSWLLNVLQRKDWMYWHGRSTNITNGGLGWDEQFAFRGRLVVLIDEHSSSDAEGFARGVSELQLGELVGVRTWGGGIWLASDNTLVDDGIASAPEVGTYNDKWGWGLGVEQQGVEPDHLVDNNPRQAFDGVDQQLEKAIEVLKTMLQKDPVDLPKDPGPYPDMSLSDKNKGCPERRN